MSEPGLNLAEVEYPSSDGEPMAETGLHVSLMVALIAALRYHFRERVDVYVTGNIFLYFRQGDNTARRAPDVMVIKGVPREPERRSFYTWEEEAMPCVVIELTSRGTQDEDTGAKKELYQQLGVREYFLFDPYQEWLQRPLVGYRLIRREEPAEGNGHVVSEYEELPPGADGSLPSAELGLTLAPRGENLALIDPRSKKEIPTPLEAYILADQLVRANQKLLAELQLQQQRADKATKQAQDEKNRADSEQKRADEATKQAQDEKNRADSEQKRADEVLQQAQDEKNRADSEQKRADEASKLADEEKRQRELLEAELKRLRALLPPDQPST